MDGYLEADRARDELAAGVDVAALGEPHDGERVDGGPRHAAGAARPEEVGAVALPGRCLHRAHLQEPPVSRTQGQRWYMILVGVILVGD